MVVSTYASGQSTLVGSVTSDSAGKHPIVGVAVQIPSMHKAARTDSSGVFRIDSLGLGTYTVLVRAVGYSPTIDTVSIDAPDGNLRSFVLPALAQPLDTVVSKSVKIDYISPALRGFEDRRHSGMGGYFLSEEQLRQLDNDRVSDVIPRFPGLTVLRNASKSIAMSTRKTCVVTLKCIDGKNRCYATIYLDGVLLYNAATANRVEPPNLNDFAIDQLAGVEFYGGEAAAPLGFRQSGCGLLLLWTRER